MNLAEPEATVNTDWQRALEAPHNKSSTYTWLQVAVVMGGLGQVHERIRCEEGSRPASSQV